MAKLALVYGLRLFPAEELDTVGEASVSLKNGRTARVTMHLIEGSKEEIEKTLRQSLDAFFEIYLDGRPSSLLPGQSRTHPLVKVVARRG